MKLLNAKDIVFNPDRISLGNTTQMNDPTGTDIFGQVGYDFVMIDAEHNALDSCDINNHIRAALAHDMVPLVRVVDTSRRSIQYATDTGAMGIVVPCIKTAADVRRAVQATRYAPVGDRGMCPCITATAKGVVDADEYYKWTNEQMLLIPMVETKEAVENIEEICGVEGIDGLFVGPYDLSCSMGFFNQPMHEQVMKALEKVAKVAKANGLGLMAPGFNKLETWIDMGYTAFQLGCDVGALMMGAIQSLQAAKDELAALK